MLFKDLSDAVSSATGFSKKDVFQILETTFELITDTVSEGVDVNIHNFGKFKRKVRPARVAYNPTTNSNMDIPERAVPVFTPGKGFKDKVEN